MVEQFAVDENACCGDRFSMSETVLIENAAAGLDQRQVASLWPAGNRRRGAAEVESNKSRLIDLGYSAAEARGQAICALHFPPLGFAEPHPFQKNISTSLLRAASPRRHNFIRQTFHVPPISGGAVRRTTPRPFSAPRDEPARATCGNGGKSNLLPFYHYLT